MYFQVWPRMICTPMERIMVLRLKVSLLSKGYETAEEPQKIQGRCTVPTLGNCVWRASRGSQAHRKTWGDERKAERRNERGDATQSNPFHTHSRKVPEEFFTGYISATWDAPSEMSLRSDASLP